MTPSEIEEKFKKVVSGDTLREKCEKQMERFLDEISTTDPSSEVVGKFIDNLLKLASVYRTLG